MAFFNSAVGVLQTLVIALGAGLGIWGAINLLEGYGNDNPGANSAAFSSLLSLPRMQKAVIRVFRDVQDFPCILSFYALLF